jgi:hypothetical protein
MKKGPEDLGNGSSPESRARVTDAAPADPDEILPEYDFRGGVRGKYAARFAEGTNLVALDPDVAAAFPDSAAVNAALRALIELADRYARGQSSAA